MEQGTKFVLSQTFSILTWAVLSHIYIKWHSVYSREAMMSSLSLMHTVVVAEYDTWQTF